MDDFEQELKKGFLEEATQLLGDAEQCFLALEANPQDLPTLEKIFRLAHNIKGSSKAVGFDSLGAFTHEFETFMLKCKNGEIPITSQSITLLLKCTDHIRVFIDGLKEDLAAQVDSSSLVSELQNFSPNGAETVASPKPVEEELPSTALSTPPEATLSSDIPAKELHVEPAQTTVEVPNRRKELPQQAEQDAAQKKPAPVQGQTDESIRVSLARLEKLLNFVGELVIYQTVLKEQAYSDNASVLRKTVHQMGKVTKEVQDISMSLRMIPLKQTFQKMQRIVRDTSGLLGKKVSLSIQGEETEVDKTVLESLGDPLVHLIRNAVDHGIEMPEERLKKGKPESGTVHLTARHESGKLVIEVKDDGGGISAEKLRKKALEKGILRQGQSLPDKESIELIFHPGFSTKAQVTEVSGRGVGMDVVKTNIEQMQGEVQVETVEGSGSTFKILLPLTLAIIDGMVVRCGSDRFIIPLSHVHESVKPENQDLKKTTGLGEILLLRGENLPVVRLSQALGKKAAPQANSSTENSEQIAIIIRTQEKPFATLVDDVIGQHQVVVKKLGSEIQSLRGFSGSAILGDGRPALILELSDLFSKVPPQNSKRQVAA